MYSLKELKNELTQIWSLNEGAHESKMIESLLLSWLSSVRDLKNGIIPSFKPQLFASKKDLHYFSFKKSKNYFNEINWLASNFSWNHPTQLLISEVWALFLKLFHKLFESKYYISFLLQIDNCIFWVCFAKSKIADSEGCNQGISNLVQKKRLLKPFFFFKSNPNRRKFALII